MAHNRRYIAVGTITAVAVIVFVYTLVHAVYWAPESELTPPPGLGAAAAAQPASGVPLRLRIPSLNINAHVQRVGIARSGNMGVPNNFTDVAWYKYGPAPGQAGKAVIDGHVDNALSLPGVFKHLGTIAPGADIYIDTATTTVHFEVVAVESYDVSQVPTTHIFDTTGPPGLALITCDGVWIQGQHQYDKRLVVYAKLAP